VLQEKLIDLLAQPFLSRSTSVASSSGAGGSNTPAPRASSAGATRSSSNGVNSPSVSTGSPAAHGRRASADTPSANMKPKITVGTPAGPQVGSSSSSSKGPTPAGTVGSAEAANGQLGLAIGIAQDADNEKDSEGKDNDASQAGDVPPEERDARVWSTGRVTPALVVPTGGSAGSGSGPTSPFIDASGYEPPVIRQVLVASTDSTLRVLTAKRLAGSKWFHICGRRHKPVRGFVC
jgi:hypothetical protein